MKKLKKAVAVLLAVLLCINAVPAAVWAEASQTTQEEIVEDALKTEQREDEQPENKTDAGIEETEKDFDADIEKNENTQAEAQNEKSASLNDIGSFTGGDGSAEHPYQIATAEQLNAVRNNLSASYVLVNDIDLSEFENWKPIGGAIENSQPFRGKFDGNGHKIQNVKINFVVNPEETNSTNLCNVGLFGYSDYGTFLNVVVENGNIIANRGNLDSGQNYDIIIGGVLGNSMNATITDSSFSGNIKVDAGFRSVYAGGIVGQTGKDIKNCSNYGEIDIKGERSEVGGISAGANSGKIINSYNFGKITSESVVEKIEAMPEPLQYLSVAGGIVGRGYQVESCYNRGDITSIIHKDEKQLIEGAAGGIWGYYNGKGGESLHVINCQNSANTINSFQRVQGVLVPKENSAFRIVNSTPMTNKDNNISWNSTKVNFNLVPDNDSEVGPDKKHGKNVEASALDVSIRPEEPVENKGFDLTRDGWPIMNLSKSFEYNSSYKIPFERYKEVFGDSFSRQHYKLEKDWNGSCYGMATTAAMFYKKQLALKDYSEENEGLNSVGYSKLKYDWRDGLFWPTLRKDSEMTKLIEQYQIYQNSLDRVNNEQAYKNRFDSDAEWFKNVIYETNVNKNPLIVYAGWKENNDDKAHALVIDTIRSAEDQGDGWYKVYLYDPNNPYFNGFDSKKHDLGFDHYNDRVLYINIKTGSWNMDVGVDGASKPIYIGKNYDVNGNGTELKEGSKLYFSETEGIPSDFSKKATFRPQSEENIGASVNIQSNNLSILNEKGEKVFEVKEGLIQVQKEGLNFVSIGEENTTLNGIVVLPDGIYTVSMEGESTFAAFTHDFFNAAQSNGKVQMTWNTYQNQMTFEALEDSNANVISQNYFGDEDYAAINIENNFKKGQSLSLNLDENQDINLSSNFEDTVKVYTEKSGDEDETIYEKVPIQDINGRNIMEFKVKNIPVTNIVLDKNKMDLNTGDVATLTPTITPDNATEKSVTWSSSDNNIATVDENGLVTAVAEGKATITVTTKDGNKTATCEVTVTKKEDSGNPGEPSNPTAPTIKPNDGQGTTTTGQLKPDTTNIGANPLTGMTFQEKMNIMAIWLAAAALCAAAIFMVKRRTEK